MARITSSAHQHLEKLVRPGNSYRKASRRKKNPTSAIDPEVYNRLSSQIDKFGRTVQKIPLQMISLNENLRKSYDEENLKLLANSLKNEGLIQFPTLCLKAISKTEYRLICRNGHRRILAAGLLGWPSIECVIVQFDSAKAELYHTINANISENVFYLDIALAYQQAANLGQTDSEISGRVGVNERTIGWYRRLVAMSEPCQQLCRQHSEIFTATWAIKLARRGPLPSHELLWDQMQRQINAKSSLSGPATQAETVEKIQLKQGIKQMLAGRKNQIGFAQDFLEALSAAGYLSKSTLKKVNKDFFSH